MTEVDTYVSSGISQLDQIVPQLAQYYKSLFADFKNWWLVLVVAIVLFYVFVSVRETKQNKLLSFLINFVSVFLCACLCFGIYPFLSKPLYAPRAMYGVGVFIAFLGITTVSKNKTFISKIVCCALAWTFFSFSFTYGNALAEQERYTEFRIEMVINDLNDLEIFTSDNVVTVQLQGNIGDSPVLSNMPKTYAILDKLVPSTFGNGWVWSEYYFYNYFKLKNVRTDGSIDLTTYNLPVLIDNMYCTIQGNEEYVLIRLK